MSTEKETHRRPKIGASLITALIRILIVLISILILSLLGYTIYEHFNYVQVQVSNVPKPKVPVASITSASQAEKKRDFVSDNWNYVDNNISIKIRKIQENSGKDTVTMFIADVTLSNINYLHTAFAKNEFGMHITQKLTTIAQDNNALFAVNGDYYGYRDNGVIVRNGVLYRDSPTRDMLTLFSDGTMSIIDEKNANVKQLLSKGLLDSFSFGPALVKSGQITGDFASVFRDQWFIQGLEPRTGVGFISPNHFVFIIVDGRMTYYSRGFTLKEFANEFLKLGCTQAYNLDGGGSSTLYFKGRIVNSPLGKSGNYERNISDIIYIDNPLSIQNHKQVPTVQKGGTQ